MNKKEKSRQITSKGVQISLRKQEIKDGSNQERCIILGTYIVENNATVRATAKRFGISKSTVHHDITTKLAYANRQLFDEVKQVLDTNKQERHIRGGAATKKKYEELSKRKMKNNT